MAKTIFKFPLDQGAWKKTFSAPLGLKPIHFGMQNGVTTMWAEVDTESTPCEYEWYYIGTGWELPVDYGIHIGSCIRPSGFVWHFYLKGPTQ